MSDVRKAAEAVYNHLGRGSIQDTDIIANALKRAKEEAFEEAAKVAEGRHKVWGTYDQVEDIEVDDDHSACREIAAAIRKLGSE